MAWQGLKLNLKVSQRQILTPGLVQMVSVLALNRLELREMINQEMIANPVLEEQNEEPTQTDNYSDETFLKAETEKVPEKPEANPFDEFDVGSFFNQYLDSGGDGGKSQEREVSERPSFEKFLSSATGLTDHLTWQLSVTICSDTVKEIVESIIGNLDENGYLTASTEELLQEGEYSQDDLDDAGLSPAPLFHSEAGQRHHACGACRPGFQITLRFLGQRFIGSGNFQRRWRSGFFR